MSEVFRSKEPEGTFEDGQRAVLSILNVFGIDASTEEMQDTAKRVIASFAELFAGVAEDAERPLRTGPSAPPGARVVALRDIEFRSTCAHHLLPFSGTATIIYAPTVRLVGLGSIVRCLEILSTRPQLQEHLGQQLAEALVSGAGAEGAVTILTARHSCVADRGPREAGSTLRTLACAGTFRQEAVLSEVLAAVG